jgi:hypothetical protein
LRFEDYDWELQNFYCHPLFREGGASGVLVSNKYNKYHWLALHFIYTHAHRDLVFTDIFEHYRQNDEHYGHTLLEKKMIQIKDETFSRLKSDITKRFKIERLNSLFENV